METHVSRAEFSIAKQSARALRSGEDAMSLPEFCRQHSISLSFYYKLRQQGLGPDEMRLGTRVLVTREAAATWRAARTAAGAA